MKSIAPLVALWIAIAIEAAWILANVVRHGQVQALAYPLAITVGFLVLAVTRGRRWWITSPLRIFVGIAFVSAVCDRLGFFGGPGTPGVSWGTFGNFIIYTGQVNPFLPKAVIPGLAVIESIIEGILGLGMLFGGALRVTVWMSSALLFVLGFAMTISLGFSSTFPFAVFVLAAGVLVMTGVDSSRISLDRLIVRLRQTH
jgi:putative oxidoreductase